MVDTFHCPATPRELGFSIDSWWPQQREAIDLILQAFIEKRKKYVIAALPTGSGKTLVASAVQRMLSQSGLGTKSLALTHTLQLQGQYQKTLDDAVVLTGKSNHLCEIAADDPHRIGEDPLKPLTAEDGPCDACPVGKKAPDGCSYYRQYYKAMGAEMVITNYAYAARILQTPYLGPSLPNPFRRPLLVCDESHLTEAALQQAAGIKLWLGPLNRAKIKLPDLTTRIEVMEGGPRSQKKKYYENVVVWQQWAEKAYADTNSLQAQAAREFDAAKQLVESTGGRSGTREAAKQAKSRLRSVTSMRSSLKELYSVDSPNEWIVKREYDHKHVCIGATTQPLFGWAVAKTMLFNHSRYVLLMSATPGDPAVSRMTLGIPQEECEYIERPSNFPAANRPVYYWPITKLNYQSSDADWEQVAKAIAWIATRPAFIQRKGLVHAGSAANAQKLVHLLNRNLGQNRSFSHGVGHKYTREGALEQFSRSSTPCILVTASFTTGLDLPDIIGWQVIAKIPFGNLGDEITSRRKAFILPNGYKFGEDLYVAECANTVIQAAGRVVRHPTDTGPTFILDAAWDVVKRKAYLPKFFLDAYQRFEP